MRFRVSETEVDKADPFINDKLGRRVCADILTGIFNITRGPFVMCLNSPRGTGKTTFVKMLRQHITNQGFPSIYFDAREADYNDNPLISFIGEMYTAIDELRRYGFDIERGKKSYKKIKKNAKDIIRRAVPVALKTAVHKPQDIEKGMDDFYAEFTSGVLEEQIKNYSAARAHAQEFRKHMRELVEHLQKREPDGAVKPLVFFIDEIDSCRPDFAVQVIDRLKGLFDIDGIIIVISADIEQLGCSVKNVFGQNIRERSYLRKFIDLEYNLPADSHAMEVYCRYLSAESAASCILESEKDAERFKDELMYSSLLMAMTFSMSLRDMNILYGSLALVFSSCGEINADTVSLAVIILSLKMRQSALYSKIINRERSVIYIINELNKIRREHEAVTGYDQFFIERRFSSLLLKPISNEEFQNQIKTLGINPGFEPGSIYKIIKERNISRENETFTKRLLNSVKMLEPFQYHTGAV